MRWPPLLRSGTPWGVPSGHIECPRPDPGRGRSPPGFSLSTCPGLNAHFVCDRGRPSGGLYTRAPRPRSSCGATFLVRSPLNTFLTLPALHVCLLSLSLAGICAGWSFRPRQSMHANAASFVRQCRLDPLQSFAKHTGLMPTWHAGVLRFRQPPSLLLRLRLDRTRVRQGELRSLSLSVFELSPNVFLSLGARSLWRSNTGAPGSDQ